MKPETRERYLVTMDMYVYACNDDEARKKSREFAKKLDDKHGIRTQVIEIGKSPFASLDYTKI